MTPERQYELECLDAILTKEEMKDGWHFCPEWDYMLVDMNDTEGEGCCCTCVPWTDDEIKEIGQ